MTSAGRLVPQARPLPAGGGYRSRTALTPRSDWAPVAGADRGNRFRSAEPSIYSNTAAGHFPSSLFPGTAGLPKKRGRLTLRCLPPSRSNPAPRFHVTHAHRQRRKRRSGARSLRAICRLPAPAALHHQLGRRHRRLPDRAAYRRPDTGPQPVACRQTSAPLPECRKRALLSHRVISLRRCA